MPQKHKVVIVGGGFGGLHAARDLRNADVDIVLIDKRNFHLFQPLLYQVATGGLSPANIAAPIRSVLAKQKNATVLLAEVTGFDVPGKRVLLADGAETYDSLIVAAGGVSFYFGNEQWKTHAPSMKSVEDAVRVRRKILLAFETAERETDPVVRHELLTFAIVGAGPTGVELAGALAEIARDTLRREFRHIDPAEARIVLLEGGPRVLPTFSEELSEYALKALKSLNVEVQTGVKVTQINADGVEVATPAGMEFIPARTVLWGAGVRASALGELLAKAAGARTDRGGRVIVEKNLTIPGHPDIFVVGDLAHVPIDDAKPGEGRALPGVAPAAIQGGAYAARTIEDRLKGRTTPPFAYHDKGSMATIGRSLAVAQLGNRKLHGLLAWFAWLMVHQMYIVCYQNRLLVLMQWAWNYFTFNRSSRMITGDAKRILPVLSHAMENTSSIAAAETVPATDPIPEAAPAIATGIERKMEGVTRA
jgi:NADH:ubiquinone reductase (H+-translocating)